IAARNALAPSMTNRYWRSVGRPCSRKRVSKRLTAAAFSVAPGSIPRMCFLPSASNAHRAENVMLGETLAIDVDHQNLDALPAALLQLLQLFDARLDGLAADGAPG